METSLATRKQELEAMRRQGNSLVEILGEYQVEKERFTRTMDDVQLLNEEERQQNKALWDIFGERWEAMEQRMTSLSDQNVLVSSEIWDDWWMTYLSFSSILRSRDSLLGSKT